MLRALVLLAALWVGCGDDAGPNDLAAPSDLKAPIDFNLGACSCLAQLCATECATPMMGAPSLACLRCLENGQTSPDAGCALPPGGVCGACYGVPGCTDPRF
ncbi:MAG TPA: hypothetical protein VF997_02280 [Polyangia bacterium]